MNASKLSVNHLFYIIPFLLFNLSAYSQKSKFNNEFTIIGHLQADDSTLMVLKYISKTGLNKIDSSFLYNNSFKFKGNIIGPCRSFLKYKNKLGEDVEIDFFIESANLKIVYNLVGNEQIAKIIGSKTNDEYVNFKESMMNIEQEISTLFLLNKNLTNAPINTEATTVNKRKKDSVNNLIALKQQNKDSIYIKYITNHYNSFLSPYLLNYLINSRAAYPINAADTLYKRFSTKIKNSYYAKEIYTNIQSSAGGIAHNFETKDINGNPVILNSFKGKQNVLLDFWASWCVPCRNDAPNLVSVYERYHNTGLNIISIANDDHRINDWKNAIKEDKTVEFIHVLQGFGTQNDIGRLFGVIPIPTKILINKKGVIVGRWVGKSIENENELESVLIKLMPIN